MIAQNRYAAWRASIVVMVILLLVGGQNALAICTFNGTSEAVFVLPATITVSRTAVVGDVLYRSSDLRTQPGISLNCDVGNYLMSEYLISVQEVSGMSRVFQTNIPGIGVKVLVTTRRPTYIATVSNGDTVMNYFFGTGLFPNHTEDFRVELIFTGIVSPGMLSLSSPLVRIYFRILLYGPNNSLTVAEESFARLFTSGTTQVLLRGCSVDNNAIAVRLPTISSSGLNSVAATAGTTRFNIALTCYPSTRVAYQFEGTSATGMVASLGVLANRTNTNDATGVGVQILAGQGGLTAPITLNTLSDTFVTTTSADQPVSIPFVARYYRTSATMTVGTVWARATFTMDYQ